MQAQSTELHFQKYFNRSNVTSRPLPAIKLKRTDTTLDLSQKAKLYHGLALDLLTFQWGWMVLTELKKKGTWWGKEGPFIFEWVDRACQAPAACDLGSSDHVEYAPSKLGD